MDKPKETSQRDANASEAEMAPRWLSGGRKDVRLEDNPTALAYAEFLRRLSSIFLKERKNRTEKSGE